MATLDDIRSKYPEYSDMSDVDLANALHRKFYKDIPIVQFYQQAGVKFDKEYNPTKDMTGAQRVRAGIGRGLSNIGRNVANVFGQASDEALKNANETDAPLLRTGGGMLGNVIGEAAAVTPLTMGIGAGVNALRGGSLAARVLTNPVARGAVEGASQGALSAGPDNRLSGAAFGGVAGAALPAAGMGIRKIATGIRRTPEAQLLLNRGVPLTPGQMNPKGMINSLEENLQSLPIVGPVIRNAREGAEAGFNKAAIQEGAVAPIAASAETVGQQLDDAFQGFSGAYATGKGFPVGPKIMSATEDVPLVKIFDRLAKKPRSGLVPADRQNEVAVLKNQLNEVIQSARHRGGMMSDDLLTFRSMIREAKRSIPNGGQRESALRELYKEAEAAVTDALESQLPADAMQSVAATDAKYAVYKTVEKAVAKARDRPQGFTGTMLSQAVKESTPTGVYARGGGGSLRDLSQAASGTFEVRAPSTGARLGTLGALVLAPTLGLPVGAGILGGAATQTGRALAAGQTSGQQFLQGLLAKPQSALTPWERQLIARYGRGLLAGAAAN